MESYTLILTRGTHVVDRRAGDAILAALAEGAPVVSVDVDLRSDGFTQRGVQLATAHVVALIPNEDAGANDDAIPFGANVTALRPARPR